ncbi:MULTISPECIES: YlaI family protein [Bacillaceae]|uniref:YlaI family protein n=2 Tax=Metabacillus TaxID=2675233 RepID=A0ABS5LDM1_9BACI|nr:MULTISPECIES: YlaI family protein [Bacillaceae]MBS2968825.1 YlaI family protein [Metabacillus flavus]
MRVKCVICDQVHTINDETLLAKRLRNRPIHTYTCPECYERIETKTKERLSTGNFRLYRDKQTGDFLS